MRTESRGCGGEKKESTEKWWAAAGDDYDSQVGSLTMLQFPRSLVHSLTYSLAHTLTPLQMDTCDALRSTQLFPLNRIRYL